METYIRNVRVGSAWLLAAVVAMFVTVVSFSTPAQAQPAPNLPAVCASFAQPVVAHIEHDVPLRKVVAAVWEGYDEAQASASLNDDGCGIPAPRALNALPGQQPDINGMSLRAMAEMSPSMFNQPNIEGARFISVGDILCAAGNERAFEAHYTLVRRVPVDAGVVEEYDDAGAPVDAGFMREEERETLHLDCGNIHSNPAQPRHWFRETVPRHASIYIGARRGHDVVLPRGGIARPTELACRSLATLADNSADEMAITALQRALRDQEPVDASVRAIAVTRITNVALDLARRINNPPPGTGGDTEELRTVRLEVRRLRGDNDALRAQNRGLHTTIDTLKELPTYLVAAIVILLVLFAFFVHWAFASNDKLAKNNKNLRRDMETAAKKVTADIDAAHEQGRAWGMKEVFQLAIHHARLKPEDLTLPVLVRESEIEVAREPLRIEIRRLSDLLTQLSWAIFSLFPDGDSRRNPGFVGVPNAYQLGDAAVIHFSDAVGAFVAVHQEQDLATIERLQSALTEHTGLVETAIAFGEFMARKLSAEHPLREALLEEANPINVVHVAIGLIEEYCAMAEGVPETIDILQQLAAKMDEIITSHSSLLGAVLADEAIITAHPASEPPPGTMSLMTAVTRLRQRLELVLELTADKVPPGLIAVGEGHRSPLARVKVRGGPGPFSLSPPAPVEDGEVAGGIVEDSSGCYRSVRRNEADNK